MAKDHPLQTAQRLIKALGESARTQATQNALDRHEAGDEAGAEFWLDVLDIVASAQASSAADNLRSGPFLIRDAVTLAERARKLGLAKS